MALDFKSKAEVLNYLEERFPDAPDGVLEALLDASAGRNCDNPPVTVYRPWWVEASQLAGTTGGFERVRSAAGSEVVYKDNASAIKALMDRQAALDASLCYIPPGFGASTARTFETVF